ncbi:hypothetical protein MQ089_08310 [Edwardsiella anguillarum]|uniref:hypothetical protein n=1 Tax=Edwardsiella anguillarum TaxID=1821960 RepID=UPI0024B870ED|nr:hypothetical protein [Edwardsiella anguillarum]WHP81812.1 DUF3450 domain-containing protein [Edwardsiella anguillarum]WHQ16397.1 DUF3450 domain-containing protein [Edwardsiella anguillarum]WHQ19315.1 DUF3450 domain-containing protein [Edwardsiella anguillarum]WHQ19930.1 DUF3450 domain-containing protein [Edwardsiella anguillarum]WHQ22859.1 DUF3450 domain-containing protein [Edwardsiella anguillarum]
MVDVSAAFTVIKEVFGLLNVVNGAKSDYEIKAATSEIQGKLITLQNDCFALGDMIRAKEAEVVALKAQIAEFEDFKQQVEGYILDKLDSGTLVYAKRHTINGAETMVYLCPNCFTKRIISILQPIVISSNFRFHKSRCLSCEHEFTMNKNDGYRSPVSRYMSNSGWSL